ncbi:MAG: nodulation protein NodZ [Spirulinaceae cyanobacterium]
MDKDKFLLLKAKSGMGNRILNLLGGILYSQITNRKIVVDWSDGVYSRKSLNVFPYLFSLKNVASATEVPDTDSVFPYMWTGNLHNNIGVALKNNHLPNQDWFTRNPITWSTSRIDFACTDYQEKVLVNWSYFSDINRMRKLLKGPFKKFSYLNEKNIQKYLFTEHLCVSKEIQERVNFFKESYFRSKNIGVHIRWTDRRTSFDEYQEIIDSIIKDNVETSIFLATDNSLVQDYFVKIYGDKILLQEKWFPDKNSAILHLHYNKDCPDKLENAYQALVDMYLLANCDYLVCNQTSTFALVAELASNTPKMYIFDTSKRKLRERLKISLFSQPDTD